MSAELPIPNTYADSDLANVPPGHEVTGVTYAELQAAGFHGGPEAEPAERAAGTAPIDELLVPGPHTFGPEKAETVLAGASFPALLDPERRIVATWDEGRWWTPSESAAFTAAILAEISDER